MRHGAQTSFALLGQRTHRICQRTTQPIRLILPARLLTEIHNAKQRLPLILPPEAVDTWLTGTPEQATDLLVSYPSELMRAHRVGKRVNKPENDDPELLMVVEA